MNANYLNQFKRNIGILTELEMRKIQKMKVAVLGCGGGSEIARQLVATGFENILVADYDEVEIHNLNRQFYFQKDIGKNKAECLSENLKMINPNLNIEVLNNGIDETNFEKIVEEYDCIIDAIPPETELKKELLLARSIRTRSNKYHIYFMDLVWGARVTIFGMGTQTFENFIGLPDNCSLSEADNLSLEQLTEPYMKDASKEMARVGELMYAGKLAHFPQMATTVTLAGSMVVTLCIFLTIGKEINFAPKIYGVDFYKLFSRNE